MTMKTLVFIFVLAITFQAVVGGHQEKDVKKAKASLMNSFLVPFANSKLKAMLESFKKIMQNGDEKLGIPILDPYSLEHLDFELTNQFFNGTLQVDNVVLTNLSGYRIKNKTDFKFKTKNLTVELFWPNVEGKWRYKVNGTTLQNIPLYGEGDLSFKAEDFYFTTQTQIKARSDTKKLYVDNFVNTSLSVQQLELIVTGLFNDESFSEAISSVTSDLIPETLEEFQEEVVTELNSFMLKRVNPFLNQYTWRDILTLS